MTGMGYKEKHAEYEKLQADRKTAVQELSVARDMGDRSENGAYKAARWKLSGIDRRLRHLKKLLDNAEVVQPPQSGVVGIGTRVTIDTGTVSTEYTIVGGHESDLSKGWISHISPLGKALMSKKQGDTAHVFAPQGLLEYSVVKVVNAR